MERVVLYDNFFNEKDLNDILIYFEKTEWMSFCIANVNVDRMGDRPFWRDDLNHELFFTKYLKGVIEKKIKKKLKLLRVYAVCQTYQQDSNYHTDSKSDGTYTFCYYINNANDDTDGHFYLKIPDEKYLLAIEPCMNRAVFFPSIYYHKGTGMNNGTIRICIAWKFVVKNEDKKKK